VPATLLNRIWKAGYVCVLLLSTVVYVGALTGTPILEDSDLIQGSPRVGGSSVASCFSNPFLGRYYRPVVPATFALERPLAGLSPIFYHQTNIVLHAVTAAILMLFLREAFARRSVALTGGILFALQPAQVGAVAWIGGRTDSLCVLFMLLFAWSLICAVRAEGGARTGYLTGCIVSYGLAVFTKEQMIPAMLLVPLAHWCWGRGVERRPGFRVQLSRLVPFLMIAACFLALYFCMDIPKPDSGESPAAWAAIIGDTVAYYTLLLLAPAPRWMHMLSLGGFIHAGIWLAVAGWLILGASLVLCYRWIRRASSAGWLMALLLISLFPVLNFYLVPSTNVAPYRAAVAGAATASLLAWFLVGVVDRLRVAKLDGALRASGSAFAALAAMCLLAWWGGLTLWGARQWSGEITIFEAMVRYDPYSTWAETNLTNSLLNAGRKGEAIASMERLLDRVFGLGRWHDADTVARSLDTDRSVQARLGEIDGARRRPRAWTAETLSRLGLSLLDEGHADRAEPCFENGARLYRRCSEAATGLGECAMLRGDYRAAVHWLEKAVALEPFQIRPLFHLGKCLAKLDRYPAAITIYSRLIQVAPWITEAYVRKAECQRRAGDVDGARITLVAAFRAAPKTSELTTLLAALDRPGARQ
jgi:tetratricopeptide (TPR) repeat protein